MSRQTLLWTAEEDDQLVALWRAGYETKEIGEKMGRTFRGVHHRMEYLRKHGRKVPRRTCKGRTIRLIEKRSCHPVVRFLVKEMTRQRATWGQIEARSGVSRECMENWVSRTTPRLTNIEAVLNVLGYRLTPVPMKDA